MVTDVDSHETRREVFLELVGFLLYSVQSINLLNLAREQMANEGGGWTAAYELSLGVKFGGRDEE